MVPTHVRQNMFDFGTHFGFGPVRLFLCFGQRLIPAVFFVDAAVNPCIDQLLFLSFGAFDAVGIHRALVAVFIEALVEQPVKYLAGAYRRGRHRKLIMLGRHRLKRLRCQYYLISLLFLGIQNAEENGIIRDAHNLIEKTWWVKLLPIPIRNSLNYLPIAKSNKVI
jgi:hypothetical protein